jgi:hypothetical protein
MNEADEIKMIETRLKVWRVTKTLFWERAKVAPSTWYKIRSQAVVPNGATMNRIRAAFSEFGEGREK